MPHSYELSNREADTPQPEFSVESWGTPPDSPEPEDVYYADGDPVLDTVDPVDPLLPEEPTDKLYTSHLILRHVSPEPK